MIRQLANDPPKELAGRRVTSVTDFNEGVESRPCWLGASTMFVVDIEGGARIVVRPSGTEPKLKCYADVEASLGSSTDPLAEYDRAKSVAAALNEALVCRLELAL
jgi:phosphomannomutase